MSDPIQDEIVKARVKLLFEAPFYGNLSTRLNLVDASSWCPSMATDGRNLYYNREFIKSLTQKELRFVLCHEILHLAFDHLGRAEGKDQKIYNMATDYIANYILKQDGIGEMPSTGLYSEKYTDEWSSEEVYEDLLKNSVKIEEPLDMHLKMDGTDGDEEEGEGSGSGEGKPGDGSGKVSTTIVGGPDGPPQLTEAEKQAIRNEMRAAMMSAAQAAGAGKVPAGIKRLIGNLTEPLIDWRALLETHMQSAIKSDYTFSNPNKRSWTLRNGAFSSSMSPILPGQMLENTIDVCVAIDTSGSMTDEMLRDFLSECKGIMEQFADFRMTVWTFDTEVHNPKVFTPENLDELEDYEPGGGGGTDFEANWHFMKDPHALGFTDLPEEIVPEKLCMFTDGMPWNNWCPPGDEEYCDTLFVIHGSRSIEAPFGLTAYYEELASKK